MIKDMLNNMVSIGISAYESPTIDEIDKLIYGTAKGPIFENLSEEEIREVRNEILSKYAITMATGACIESKNYKYKKWFLSKKSEIKLEFWDRYKQYLISDKSFPSTVVNKMDSMLDTLTDLLGNPEVDEAFQRKGLIVGDVQSGKTSNYNGLICKGADAGYKVIIILTGTIESLRKQTQLRMDEGFCGIDSAIFMKDKERSAVGVSKYNKNISTFSLTSTNSDFRASNAKNMNFDIKSINGPVLFVLKKNVTTLKNINKWLEQSVGIGEKQINNSLLLIDDESDNASVNTKKEETDPTTINKSIRELLMKFKKSSYVGFTATPFANIFIEPDTENEMENQDLFPRDFIYSLNPPSNYIGARNIFSEDGSHKYMLKIINEEELEDILPIKHKKDYVMGELPNDLKEAICTFLVANAIRDLRGDINKHRSMLINISRFTDVQATIYEEVNDFVIGIKDAIRIKATSEKALENKFIKQLKKAYDNNYSKLEFEWREILAVMHKAIASVTTIVVNQKNKANLDYEEYPEGLRVIAIGGLSLSRGLTLEGLIVSYFYRNSKMYDTLMQMGRWFGYRPKYEDLCRIWMSEDAISWYSYISQATDDLREDIKRYENSGLTPLDFGLRVRSDITSLLVTARNKMRTASDREISVSLSGKVEETPYIFKDKEINDNNKKAIKRVLTSLDQELEIINEEENKEKNNIYENSQKIYNFEKRKIYKNIRQEKILEILANIDIPVQNGRFNTDDLRKFIKNYSGDELDKWDISFGSGSIDVLDTSINERGIKPVLRAWESSDKVVILNKMRLGTTQDGKIGLSKCESENVNVSKQDDYFKIKRNPLLLIYLVNGYEKDKNKELNKDNKNQIKIDAKNQDTLVGFSIGIPNLADIETSTIKYKVNKIQQRLMDQGIWDVNEIDDEIGDDE